MAALGVDPNAIEPAALFADATLCLVRKRQCEWHLRQNPCDSDWQHYCLNTARLRALSSAVENNGFKISVASKR
jgi:hypothetical protein